MMGVEEKDIGWGLRNCPLGWLGFGLGGRELCQTEALDFRSPWQKGLEKVYDKKKSQAKSPRKTHDQYELGF